MKKSMSRLVALALALILVLSASALAAERASDPFRVPGAKQRPVQPQATPKPTMEPEVVTPEDDSWTLGGLPIEPMPEPSEEPAPEQSVEPSAPAEPEAPVEPEAPAVPEQPAEPEAPAVPEQPAEPEAPAAPEQSEAPAEPEATPEPSEEPEAPAPQEPAAPKFTVQLSEGRLNVREEASSSADVIASLHSGDTVELLGEEGAWSKVRLADGTVGYVFSKYLSTGEPEPQPEPEAKPEPEPEVSEQPVVQTVVYNYERNADGSLKLDESGNPIAILPEGATEKPAGFLRDKNGALVLVDGIPVPTQFVPVDAQKVHTIEDALDPHRTIDIYADWGGGQLYFGMESQLIAVLNGYDNLVYSIQWQTSPDDATWENIPGATQPTLVTTVTEDNYLDYWRVEVTITDVIDPEEA